MARKAEDQSRTRDVSSAERDLSSTKIWNAIYTRLVSPPPGIAASSSPLWVGGTRSGSSARVHAVDGRATRFWTTSLTSGRLLGVARAPPLVNRWSIREQLQEPCYLVELLDRGWTQRNVLVRQHVHRVLPTRPPPTFATIQEEVEQLLGDSNRTRDRPVSSDVAANRIANGIAHGTGDDISREEEYYRVGNARGRSGRKLQSRRSCSAGAVRRRLEGRESVGEEGDGVLSPGDGGSVGEVAVRARSISMGMEIGEQSPLRSDNMSPCERTRSLTGVYAHHTSLPL